MISAREASKNSMQIAVTQRRKDNAQANLILNTDINNCIVNAVLAGKFKVSTTSYSFESAVTAFQFESYIKKELRDNGYAVKSFCEAKSIEEGRARGPWEVSFNITWPRKCIEEA